MEWTLTGQHQKLYLWQKCARQQRKAVQRRWNTSNLWGYCKQVSIDSKYEKIPADGFNPSQRKIAMEVLTTSKVFSNLNGELSTMSAAERTSAWPNISICWYQTRSRLRLRAYQERILEAWIGSQNTTNVNRKDDPLDVSGSNNVGIVGHWRAKWDVQGNAGRQVRPLRTGSAR
jgi:hypothetical protein